MTFYQLFYVAETAKYSSISKAAEGLNISQPTLSETIHSIEKEYGIAIFSRSKEGISLTEEGAEFLTYAHRILSNVDELNQNYEQTHDLTENLSVSSSKIPFVLETFQEMLQESENNDRSTTCTLLENSLPM